MAQLELIPTDEERAIRAAVRGICDSFPEDYSRRLLMGQEAQVLIMVDGSTSSVAGEAVNVGNAIGLRESLKRVLGERQLLVDTRPRVLFKHSFSCGISAEALDELVAHLSETTVDARYAMVTVQTDREVSNAVTQQTTEKTPEAYTKLANASKKAECSGSATQRRVPSRL